MEKRFSGIADHVFEPVFGESIPSLLADDREWGEPARWNEAARRAGERPRVVAFPEADFFSDYDGPMTNASGGQLFVTPGGGWVTKDAWIGDVRFRRPLALDDCRERFLALVNATPHLQWLILTNLTELAVPTLKRVGLLRANERTLVGADVAGLWADGTPPDNVWLGANVEGQQQAWLQIERLRVIPAACRWVCVNIGRGGVDLSPWLVQTQERDRGYSFYRHDAECVWDCGRTCGDAEAEQDAFHWVVIGGRPHPDLRSLVDQLGDAMVPCFVTDVTWCGGAMKAHVPESYRVREFPTVES